jgi:hypothetical protein
MFVDRSILLELRTSRDKGVCKARSASPMRALITHMSGSIDRLIVTEELQTQSWMRLSSTCNGYKVEPLAQKSKSRSGR